MMIDLHTHSTFSDGEDTPTELIEQAHKIGLTAIALTDHDVVSGCPELQRAAKKYPDLLAINGCEFGVDHPATMEIIALNIKNLAPYIERQNILVKSREDACRERIEKLHKLGYHITWEDVAFDKNNQPRKMLAKPHIVKFLVKSGQINDKEFAYKQLLAEGGPAYVEAKSPSPEDTIDFIRQTGAVSILAHPCLIKLKGQDLFNEIARLQKCGLQGIEVEHSHMSADEIKEYHKIADTLGLLKSGGSDFHGKGEHYGSELGIGRGQVHLPDEYLEKIMTASTAKNTMREILEKSKISAKVAEVKKARVVSAKRQNDG